MCAAMQPLTATDPASAALSGASRPSGDSRQVLNMLAPESKLAGRDDPFTPGLSTIVHTTAGEPRPRPGGLRSRFHDPRNGENPRKESPTDLRSIATSDLHCRAIVQSLPGGLE